MQKTSALYKELLSSNHKMETRLAIGETGILVTQNGEAITFGGVSILTGASDADGGYDESLLVSMETDTGVFSQESLSVGDCIVGQINIEMHKPYGEIPERARLVPYVRLTDISGTRKSEWIQKGVFYIDTREKKEDGSKIEKILLQGYDDLRKAEQDYPESFLDWPAADIDVVLEISDFLGVSVDERTFSIISRGYPIQYPAGYSCRETLGYIASMYAGCWVMSDLGELRLVTIHGIPVESRYLIDHSGYSITFGGDRIIV